MKTLLTSAARCMLLLILLFPLMSNGQEEKPVKDFQMSLFPGLGTDGTQASQYKYHFSLNLFAGITGGLEGFEAGGFMNVNRGNVQGAQFAGFGNVVHGDVEGFQASGFINVNHGSASAVQFTGFANVVSGSAEGLMASGFINTVGMNAKGFNGAGFINVTGGDVDGVQLAGFANTTGGSGKGVQGSGFMNVTRHQFEGLQLAGFGNVVGGEVKGPMIAGFMNVSGDIEGMQLSGFINVARKVKGVQIGFINVADSVSGVPIGFLSVVKKGGYRQFELSGSSVMHMGASFRIGVPALYNIFSYGARPFSDEVISGFGYGIGTEISLNRTLALQLEAHHTKLERDYQWSEFYNDQLNEFRATLDARIGDRIQLFAGPVLYNQIYRSNPSEGFAGANLSENSFYESSWNDYVSKWWGGARGGIRFRLND